MNILMLVVSIIVGIVGLRITSDIISDANFTGTTATMVNLVPLGLALGLFIAAFKTTA